MFPAAESEFWDVRNSVEEYIDTDSRFPEWPFRGKTGYGAIFEYGYVLSGRFGSVLHRLVKEYGDESVDVVGVEPAWQIYRSLHDHSSSFRISGEDVESGYGAAMYFRPHGVISGALGHTLSVVAIVGSSRNWSVFAQLDWEIGVLLARSAEGLWLADDVPWFPLDIDLDEIRSPVGWAYPLEELDLREFARQCRRYGYGP